MDSLVEKTKKIKRGRSRKNNLKKKEETPKVVPTPPKKEKVWKQKEGAPKSTATPPKSNKMVWVPKKAQPTSLALMYLPQARNEGEESCSLDYKRSALSEGKLVVILYNLLKLPI